MSYRSNYINSISIKIVLISWANYINKCYLRIFASIIIKWFNINSHPQGKYLTWSTLKYIWLSHNYCVLLLTWHFETRTLSWVFLYCNIWSEYSFLVELRWLCIYLDFLKPSRTVTSWHLSFLSMAFPLMALPSFHASPLLPLWWCILAHTCIVKMEHWLFVIT